MVAMAYLKLLDSYKKQGYEIKNRRKTKLADWAFLGKDREGWFASGYYGIYLYFVDGDVTLKHMNDFLKRYGSAYEEHEFDDEDQGVLAYTGDLNTREFRAFARKVLEDYEYKSMKLKKVKPVAVKKTRVKAKRVEEEEIKEKITIERETKRKVVEEVEISVDSIRRSINKWKDVAPKVSGRGKERKMTLSMTGYLALYPDIAMEYTVGSSKVDAVIGNIGIEAKYRPDQNEINRLYGQVDDYLRGLEHIIVVFYDTNQSMINNFRRKLRTGGYSKQVTVVSA